MQVKDRAVTQLWNARSFHNPPGQRTRVSASRCADFFPSAQIPGAVQMKRSAAELRMIVPLSHVPVAGVPGTIIGD